MAKTLDRLGSWPDVCWSKEDWIDFYHTLQALKLRVAARAKGARIIGTNGAETPVAPNQTPDRLRRSSDG